VDHGRFLPFVFWTPVHKLPYPKLSDDRDFFSQARVAFRLAPVRALRLESGRGPVQLGQLRNWPRLERLTELDLTGLWSSYLDEAVLALGPSRRLGRLRSFRVARGALRLGALLDAPWLAQLTRLSLAGFSEGPVADGLRSACLDNLQELELTDTVWAEEIDALASSRFLTNITALRLVRCQLIGSPLHRLTCARFPRLTTLDLSHNNLTGPAEALLASPLLATVEDLGLSGNSIRQYTLHRFCDSPHLGRLARLELCANGLGSRDACALAEAGAFPRLAALHLGANRIGDDGARALAKSPDLTALTSLDLSNNGLSEIGARALLASPLLERLRALRLTGNPIPAAVLADLRSALRGALIA
jgi:hypothetical protein